ncbi:hypothetical protein [Armatimonas sp.]|uniref:hypothetical protein n=1 Tax=Armatimonas sp. TaxID=1872638 RepID=UPI00286B99B3|nr:hypothetical protein [Armatimonas sp.]
MTRARWNVIGGMALGAALTVGFAATMQQANAQKGKDTSNTLVAQELPQPPQGGFGGGGQGGFGGPPGGGQGGFGGQGGPPGGGGGFGGPGGGQGRPGGMGGMMGMMGGGGASIAATDKYVYILRGDQLLQYSVDGLKLTAKATLPRPEGGPGGPGGPGGRN